MAVSKDWLPASRDEQLAMAKNWGPILSAKGAQWGIPEAAITELAALTNAADGALATAKHEATRTPVATAQCKTAFEALTAKMRDSKKRYFYVPPLTDADLVSLGLKPQESQAHTPQGAPTAQVTGETYLVGRHELGVKIVYVTGDPNDKANKGFRIWYKVLAPGEAAPSDPEQLTKSFYTKRKKDVVEFGYNDSGKTVWFAIQIENGGKKGPWGPLLSALIP
jgi:hypothetical protein